jgi:hypothetical protein
LGEREISSSGLFTKLFAQERLPLVLDGRNLVGEARREDALHLLPAHLLDGIDAARQTTTSPQMATSRSDSRRAEL